MSRFLLAAIVVLSACSRSRADGQRAQAGESTGPQALAVTEVARGLDSPVHLTSPSGDARLFVVEQSGRIRIIENGRLSPTPFLDIRDRLASGGERGLLGLAFHPQYASNGYFFVNYTDREGDTRIERYRVTSGRNVADPRSATLLLTIKQPYSNHNGGLVAFGPDGMLYIGMGDGGSGGDPQGNGQNARSLLGKLLRIDVDHAEGGRPYAIPRDNPRGELAPEAWALGLRNPWRFSWDSATSLLYIADVGQNQWEEVNVTRASDAGLNYGWNRMEGRHCFRLPVCREAGLTLPAVEYDHSIGCSITGGYVYRGRAIPELVGHYVYSDWCGGWLRSFKYVNGTATERRVWPMQSLGSVTSFGVGADGELYVMNGSGVVSRLDRRR